MESAMGPKFSIEEMHLLRDVLRRAFPEYYAPQSQMDKLAASVISKLEANGAPTGGMERIAFLLPTQPPYAITASHERGSDR